MFPNFDPSLLKSPDFKEDSVREIIITPMLTRLGYSPSGQNRITRSKTLRHPFIYAGTRKCPVNIIPDYTLFAGEKAILVLDAKRPSEDISSTANVQQAYSYAVHPEVKTQHFALCNGCSLAVFSVDAGEPLLEVAFAEFEKRWIDIERHLSPRFLLEPILRQFAPDLGFAFNRLGLAPETTVTMLDVHLNTFARVDDQIISASTSCDFAGRPHMASFDFHPSLLPLIVAGVPKPLKEIFLEALNRAPFQACADLMIAVDIDIELGAETQGASETFIPFLVKKVRASRFDPHPVGGEALDVPEHVFRLSKTFTFVEPEDG